MHCVVSRSLLRSWLIGGICSIGFANFGSMGIALATLSAFAPERKRALVGIALRALIGGNMVSLMTASIAGRQTSNVCRISPAFLPRSAVQSYECRGHRFRNEFNTPVNNLSDAHAYMWMLSLTLSVMSETPW